MTEMLAVRNRRGYILNGDLVTLRDAITLLSIYGGHLEARGPTVWEVVVND